MHRQCLFSTFVRQKLLIIRKGKTENIDSVVLFTVFKNRVYPFSIHFK